jgi:hypothetical protein
LASRQGASVTDLWHDGQLAYLLGLEGKGAGRSWLLERQELPLPDPPLARHTKGKDHADPQAQQRISQGREPSFQYDTETKYQTTDKAQTTDNPSRDGVGHDQPDPFRHWLLERPGAALARSFYTSTSRRLRKSLSAV